jgi:starvation-inducible DNA-binding protein
MQVKIDDIAERILTLGYTPDHSYTDYKKISTIKESGKVSDGITGVKDVLASMTVLITLQREIMNLSADAGDEGTNALMSDYIRAQEKLVWMYTAFLNK